MVFKFYAIKLSVAIIFIFLLQLISGFTDLFLLNQNWYELWRFITSIFLHGDIAHLLYNLFALVLFGSILEKFIGGKRFLIVFFISGILANIISINFYTASLGASGAIFGIIGALIIVNPTTPVFAFGLPMPIFIAGILWAVGDAIGIFMPSNVANIAHLSGMFFGIIFGILYRQRKSMKKKVFIDEKKIRRWEDSWS